MEKMQPIKCWLEDMARIKLPYTQTLENERYLAYIHHHGTGTFTGEIYYKETGKDILQIGEPSTPEQFAERVGSLYGLWEIYRTRAQLYALLNEYRSAVAHEAHRSAQICDYLNEAYNKTVQATNLLQTAVKRYGLHY